MKEPSLISRSYLTRILTGCLIGLIPVALSLPAFAGSGYPLGGEIFSNLMPAQHARFSILAGELPLHTDLFYSGRNQYANPLWYGFYPLAWILFIPGIDLALASKVVLGFHLLLTTTIAYYYAREDFDWWLAAPFALLWVMPIASQFHTAHLEKVFAWPWVVLAAWQLTPSRIGSSWRSISVLGREVDVNLNGAIAGAALGVAFLSGGNYYFVYGSTLVFMVAVLLRNWGFVVSAIGAGFCTGWPHLISIYPSLASNAHRPPVWYSLTPTSSIKLVAGFTDVAFMTQGYAVVGVGALILAAIPVGVVNSGLRWRAAVCLAGVTGMLLATASSLLYSLPGVDVLRIAARANVLVALAVLLLSWKTIKWAVSDLSGEDSQAASTRMEWKYTTSSSSEQSVNEPRRKYMISAAGALLGLSALQSAAAWNQFDSPSVEISSSTRSVADAVEAIGATSVWIESTPSWSGESFGPTSLQFELTSREIAVRAGHYGAIGQEWEPTEDGQYTFEALITPAEVPADGDISLTKADSPDSEVGSIPVTDLRLAEVIRTENGAARYVYAVQAD